MPIPTAEEKLKWIKVIPATQEELDAVAKLSPGDYEIGFQRTNDILDEALEVFQRSCRSSMGISGDVMVALFTAQGDLVNGAAGTYLHAIIQPILIKYILTNYSQNPGVKEGDVWVANDALYGGIHNPDIVALVPVFYKGQLIAWCEAANHTTETGAVEPGGMPVTASARFTEGMNLPPMKVGENGQLREDWLELFNAYGIRAPQMVVTDLKARSTAADRARTRVVELAEKEGPEFVIGLLRKMLIVAEEGARKRIASWPDGKTEGQGGRATSAGMDASHFAWCPFGRSPDVELMENEFPLLLPISQHWMDSGGHGAHRGGCGTVQVWVAHQAPAVFFVTIADNSKVQTPQPLFGGYAPPTVPGISVRGADILQRMAAGDSNLKLDFSALINREAIGGEWGDEPFIRSVRPYNEGDVITFGFASGGAGYGDPLDANPQQVVQDVEAETVSDWSARTIYKVTYDADSMRVNQKETEALRQAEREARLARGKTWDVFIEEWSQLKPPEEALAWFGTWPDGAVVAPVFRP